MFHQKQFKNYCRCHAINNFLGYEAISYQTFDTYCDEFDVKNKMPLISKKNQYFYNNGGNDNIFGYILEKLKYQCKLETFYMDINILKNINLSTVEGFFIFNNHHTWCIRKVKGKFYMIDSLKWMITRLNNEKLSNYLKGCSGVISITSQTYQ